MESEEEHRSRKARLRYHQAPPPSAAEDGGEGGESLDGEFLNMDAAARNPGSVMSLIDDWALAVVYHLQQRLQVFPRLLHRD